jgi:hypothetical protein
MLLFSRENINMNSQWEKIGDFNQIHNFRGDVPLNRQVTFKSRLLDNPVKEFTLCGYQDGGFQIIAEARNRQSYEQLRQAVVQPGIEEPDFFNSDMKIIRLTTSHLGLIGNFLNAIESIEPRFESVKQEVCTTLGLNLTQTYSAPVWLIEGNFNQTQHYGAGVMLNRQLTFKNTHLSHCIKELELLGYQDGTFRLVAKARNDQAFEQLSQAIIQAGFEAPDFMDRVLKRVELNNFTLATYSQSMNNFINAIQRVLPEVEIIRQDILNAIQNLALHSNEPQLPAFPRVPHLPMHNFPSRTRVNPLISLQNFLTAAAMNASFENSQHSAPSLPPPNAGINENRVEELQKKYESKHKSQIEIPEKFLCALMNIVMTTPVSVPQTPDVRFEQSQILHWLATNPRHPLTRSPLNPHQLVVDEKLQQEIEHFISEEEKKLSEPTVEPTVEPVVHAFKRRTRTIQIERLTEEANHFIGGELPAKRKRISRIAH